AVEKDGGLRHDQIGLQVIGRGSSIELIEREVAIGDVGSVAGLIVPGLKMRGLGRTDAEQNPQDLRMGDALGELRIQTASTLLDEGKVKASSVGNGLQVVVD